MHRTPIAGGFATNEHLDHLELRPNGRVGRVETRVERLERKVNLILGEAVRRPSAALTRLLIGPCSGAGRTGEAPTAALPRDVLSRRTR